MHDSGTSEQAGRIRETIYTVLAPVLADFTVWVLHSAKARNIKRLYFLARDAYPFYAAADSICKNMNLNIECIYFNCSRFSLRVPMYSENMAETMDYLCRSGIDVTIDKIFSRANLELREVPEITIARIESIAGHTDVLNRSQLSKVKAVLSGDEEFATLVKKKSEEAWPYLEAYFRQERILDPEAAIVDSGWSGSTQKTINQIRKRCGAKNEISGYYFGLYEIPDNEDDSKYNCFYFSPYRSILNSALFSNCFFEALLSSKEQGTTIGYYSEDGIIKPILAENKATEVERLINRELIKATIQQAGVLLNNSAYSKSRSNSRAFKRLMCLPNEDEAEVFGEIGFSDDLLDDTLKPLAPVMSENMLKENHALNRLLTRFGIKKIAIHECGWYEGSAVRSSSNYRTHIRHFIFYKCLRSNAMMIRYRVKRKKVK